MWVPRTSDEKDEWYALSKREAGKAGHFAVAVVIVIDLVGFGTLAVINQGESLKSVAFWLTMVAFAMVLIPIAALLGWHIARKEMALFEAQTICPNCEATSQENHGASCDCGGTFALMSEMKWEDDEVDEDEHPEED